MSLPRSQNELITSPRRGCKARPIALSSTTSHTPSPSPTPTHGHGWVSVPTGLCWGCCWTSPSFSGRLGALCVKNKQRFLSRVSCTLGRKVVMGMSSPPKKKTQDEKRSPGDFLHTTTSSGLPWEVGLFAVFPWLRSARSFTVHLWSIL